MKRLRVAQRDALERPAALDAQPSLAGCPPVRSKRGVMRSYLHLLTLRAIAGLAAVVIPHFPDQGTAVVYAVP